MERRNDPWADFLRRILLSASLASVTTVAAKTGTDTPPEMADAEPGTTASPAMPTATAQA